MRIVIADAGPIHYLVLIGQIDLLSHLFERVLIPAEVQAELLHPAAPAAVKNWTAHPPSWLIIAPAPPQPDPALAQLDEGERAAITLALSLKADLVLMDDRAGVRMAHRMGLTVIGTIGLLDLAARRRLINIGEAIAKLKTTNFRYPPKLLDDLVARYRAGDTE